MDRPGETCAKAVCRGKAGKNHSIKGDFTKEDLLVLLAGDLKEFPHPTFQKELSALIETVKRYPYDEASELWGRRWKLIQNAEKVQAAQVGGETRTCSCGRVVPKDSACDHGTAKKQFSLSTAILDAAQTMNKELATAAQKRAAESYGKWTGLPMPPSREDLPALKERDRNVQWSARGLGDLILGYMLAEFAKGFRTPKLTKRHCTMEMSEETLRQLAHYLGVETKGVASESVKIQLAMRARNLNLPERFVVDLTDLEVRYEHMAGRLDQECLAWCKGSALDLAGELLAETAHKSELRWKRIGSEVDYKYRDRLANIFFPTTFHNRSAVSGGMTNEPVIGRVKLPFEDSYGSHLRLVAEANGVLPKPGESDEDLRVRMRRVIQ